ncbi:uncharacterized protein BJ212DRAFT_1310549 [Suillus subaureus]|uniref:Uncharacterized protein n=1 Tax=Suillus subaureus TaxID=48587 RepID=A0A9P7EPJ5_9AGAM|nr:uncharacterized protein BJ212DRAFT_1310549 [Suillus subaureus]KAG1827147.1 hypothetical protein BJ212DRAFT_1310549 [Suillus subaureus]
MLHHLQPYDMPLLCDCDNLLQDLPHIVLVVVTSGLGDSVALKPARSPVLMLLESNPRSMMLASMILMPVTCQWMHFLTIWLPGVNRSILTAISMQMVDFHVQTTPKSMMWVTLLLKMWKVAQTVFRRLIMGMESIDTSQIRCIMIFGPISAQPMFFLCFFLNITN